MNDLIYRQSAINAIITEGRTVDSRYLESERILHESDAVEAISMLPSAEPWIPVSERLPEKNGLYLVTYVSGKANIDFSFFRMKKWHGLVNGEWTDYWYPVTAWMPLPEPYEGGDAE